MTRGAPGAQDPDDADKRAAARAAVHAIESGMRVGLGTGSTALHAVRRLGALLQDGSLRDVSAIATSSRTRAEAGRLGIPLIDDDLTDTLDLTIDGADEVDPSLDLIKGGGGALLREKIVAQASRRLIVVVDASKLTPRLGTRRPLPVEVIPFGWRDQLRYIEALGAAVTVRRDGNGAPFSTDSGHMILDCAFGPIADPRALAASLAARPGIVEHGLFLGMAHEVIVAGPGGVRRLARPAV